MSNFRPERAFVMLESGIPGFDHVKAIDPFKLSHACFQSTEDADRLSLEPLRSFTIAAGERSYQPREKPRWKPPMKGLKTVRALIEFYDDRIAKGEGGTILIPQALPPIVETLRQLEAVLDKADTYDRRFCIALKDLA